MSLVCAFALCAFTTLGAGPAACGVGSGASPMSLFINGSDDSLLGRYVADAEAMAETEFVRTDSSTGLAVRQRQRWISECGALVIESALTNPTSSAVSTDSTPILEWGFRIFDEQDDGRYRALSPSQDVWYGSSFWTGPDWTRVGKDWQHSGENTPSVRRFTAPRDGRLTVSERVYKADTNNGGGDGVKLEIRHGRETVWSAEIDGNDAQGVEPGISMDVRKGDAIRFVVHKRGHIACDTTHWDPVLTYDDGERYQASEAFSAIGAEQSCWRCEMETDPSEARGLPVVRVLTVDAALREATTMVGTAVAHESKDILPLVVISDETDKSGLALAMTRAAPWTVTAELSREGILHVAVKHGNTGSSMAVESGSSLLLPHIIAMPYSGPWSKGFTAAQSLLESGVTDSCIDELRKAFASVQGEGRLSLDLWALVQADWHAQDKLSDSTESYASATRRHYDKARQLLADLRAGQSDDFLSAESQRLSLMEATIGAEHTLDEWRSLYAQVRGIKREIAFKNPLLNFDQLLFCKRVPTSYSHLVMQYYGWRARPGGGLFVLERPGYSLKARDLLDGQLSKGNVLEPRLSYDAKRIVFSYVACTGKNTHYNALNNEVDEDFYHVWEVNVDGSGLHQLTSGPYDDLMPTYLPDGGIAFCSTRRKGYARCFGEQFSPRWHVYTLHRMNGDGSGVRTLSYHDTNEWFPSVSNTGLILYSRWDYIDRDAVTHQNLWSSRPDGTNPMALWGNATPAPHCTFQIQPIPNSSKMVFTASAHHSITGGSIAVVDPTIANNGEQALTRITPEVPFPEAETRDIPEYYESPWPLSEKYFLVSYSPTPLVWEPGANAPNALGLYLLDAAGNRELLYRDPDIGCSNAVPLVPRPAPPVVP
ncbi:MAG: hypothetical protein K1Y02_26725, partial [Candidatus Hydrogenedentes bacterium]|nr:hypothetical protein [Candidatus Hydrogenedentota bacterium]